MTRPIPALALALLAGALLAPLAQAQEADNPAVAAAAKEPGAKRLASGMVLQILKEGSGARPTASDAVQVHYRGSLADAGPRQGEEFDSSIARGQPATFPLRGVIPCWTEGLQHLAVGGKAKLTCPPQLAYGARGAGRGLIPPQATLSFEVELLGIAGR